MDAESKTSLAIHAVATPSRWNLLQTKGAWLEMSTLLSFMKNDFTVNNTQKVIKIPLKMNQNS